MPRVRCPQNPRKLSLSPKLYISRLTALKMARVPVVAAIAKMTRSHVPYQLDKNLADSSRTTPVPPNVPASAIWPGLRPLT